MKYQVLFSLKNNEKMSSAAIVTGALMVNKDISHIVEYSFGLLVYINHYYVYIFNKKMWGALPCKTSSRFSEKWAVFLYIKMLENIML